MRALWIMAWHADIVCKVFEKIEAIEVQRCIILK